MEYTTRLGLLAAIFISSFTTIRAAPYSAQWVDYNLNQMPTVTPNVSQYRGSWFGHAFTPSPQSWRDLPTYTIIPDRWINGDPANDDYFGTVHESDITQTQLRFGGDIKGLADPRTLDYLQGMGVRTLYVMGSPFVNMPWQADQYSSLDFTVLDPHLGTIAEWRQLIEELHARGMYLIMDFTITTMIGFEGYLNTSADFDIHEHKALWLEPDYAPWGIDKYLDFSISNEYNQSCLYPRFWYEDGERVPAEDLGTDGGCYASEFDQYGTTEAFGVYPDWRRQITSFASVQDRLREWTLPVGEKLKVFGCLAISMLDIDGIRIDKAIQITVDYSAEWVAATRECARTMGKNNFFISGEVTSGATFGALYYGRGRTPEQLPPGFLEATNMTTAKNASDPFFLRDVGQHGFDSSAFHYSIYRSLTRFLGMDGNLNVAFDVDVNFVTAWNQMVSLNDFLNADTGLFDPRHLYGTSNQDVFRWPAITNGTQKNLLANFVTHLLLPGIPLLFCAYDSSLASLSQFKSLADGEEQDFYVFDSQAANYLYGRAPMASSIAFQMHGCYVLGSEQYYQMPLDKALNGCRDDWVSLDHLDPTAASRSSITHFNWLRANYGALRDGFSLVQLGNWTTLGQLPGSNMTTTEFGLFSALRGFLPTQTITGPNPEAQVHLLYSNLNVTQTFAFDCQSDLWISTPFQAGQTVRNLFSPYERYQLSPSLDSFFSNGTAPFRGCLPSVEMPKLGFKALVLDQYWSAPPTRLTAFKPGHDARLSSTGRPLKIDISLEYSDRLDCKRVAQSVSVVAVTNDSGGISPYIDPLSITCEDIIDAPPPSLVGALPSAWRWSASIANAVDGVYQLTVRDPTGSGTTDHLLLRKGEESNPMVFPMTARYSNTLLALDDRGIGTIRHDAAGADSMRWSTDYGARWSRWQAFSSRTPLPWEAFNGTDVQDRHVDVQYFSSLLGSAAHMVSGDMVRKGTTNILPPLNARGPFNLWSYDASVDSELKRLDNGSLALDVAAVWPTLFQITPRNNLQGDFSYGDVEGDGVLDRLPPNTLSAVFLNVTYPPWPHLAYTIMIDEVKMTWWARPMGHVSISIAVFFLLALVPIISGVLSLFLFRRIFYSVYYNKYGFGQPKRGLVARLFPGAAIKRAAEKTSADEDTDDEKSSYGRFGVGLGLRRSRSRSSFFDGASIFSEKSGSKKKMRKLGTGWPYTQHKRRTVLIATLEYEVPDWPGVKVKIGGLYVMAALMARVMSDVDLVWVIPKIKDIEYPEAERLDPYVITLFGEQYEVEVQRHQWKNVTYILLDSPIFRGPTKTDPYPPRMDDISSALYYSAFNQSIAETIRRTPAIDIYHINDYHGALAPLYLLPRIMPVVVSLHNAEFQGLWPLRNAKEVREVCEAYNLPVDLCTKYVRFGNTFNLLHAAASFASIHQNSFGVAGVSDAYGKRSWSRYPALWCLKTIDSLANPDPTDLAELDKAPINTRHVVVDAEAEAARPEAKRQAQEWAGLEQDPKAELFVFVGRWSKQKGIDLIADVFPQILEERPDVQLITVGPQIDLYGKLAAIKLDELMKRYPKQVCSKPVFTALPPYIFSGSDFALMPSRDEPFGLVAIEFGRKGALGVGSRLGGLGLMPGWWFSVESDSTDHLLDQLSRTIGAALKSTEAERALLRARSAVLRFPTLAWRQKLEAMHAHAVRISNSLADSAEHRPFAYLQQSLSASSDMLNALASSRKVPATVQPGASNDSGYPTPPQTPKHRRTVSSTSWTPHHKTRSTVETSPYTPSPPRMSASVPHSPVATPPLSPVLSHESPSMSIKRKPVPLLDPFTDASVRSAAMASSLSLPGVRRAPRSILRSPTPSDTEEDEPRPSRETERVSEDSERWEVGVERTRRDSAASVATIRPQDDRAMPLPPSGTYISSRAASSSVSLAPSPRSSMDRPRPPPSLRTHSAYPLGSSSSSLSRAENKEDAISLAPLALPSGAQSPTLGRPTSIRFGQYGASSPIGGFSTPYLPRPAPGQGADPTSPASFAAMLSAKLRDSPLAQGIESFDDAKGEAQATFLERLSNLSAKSSRTDLSIEKFITSQERSYFRQQRRRPRLVSHSSLPPYTIAVKDQHTTSPSEVPGSLAPTLPLPSSSKTESSTRGRAVAEYEICGWPLYTIILSIGQILCATTFQITLLSGTSLQSDEDLYVLGGIFLAGTLVWYSLLRTVSSYHVLSLVFVSFGLAFLLVGIPSLNPAFTTYQVHHSITLTAAAFYALASSAFFVLFSLNFGLEAGAASNVPVFRAWLIQGLQTLWTSALWYLGFQLSFRPATDLWAPKWLFGVTCPLGVLCFVAAVILHRGLPAFYRTSPPQIHGFWTTLFRRKLVLWFLFADVVRNFWLSAPYGRNWQFLWQSGLTPPVATVVMLVVFFVGVWTLIMYALHRATKTNSWAASIFAVGLGTPRWCQMLWSLSGMGLYLPWLHRSGAPWLGGYFSIGLWLWLGTLDAVQGVGIGIMLLQTLSRQHVGAAIAASQVVGVAVVMAAKRTWPFIASEVFPNFAFLGTDSPVGSPLASWPFWSCLVMQAATPIGFFLFYRNELLSRP